MPSDGRACVLFRGYFPIAMQPFTSLSKYVVSPVGLETVYGA